MGLWITFDKCLKPAKNLGMSSDRLFEDLEAQFISLGSGRESYRDELLQAISGARVQILGSDFKFWIEPMLVAKEFLVGRGDHALVLIPHLGCAAIRGNGTSRKSAVVSFYKGSLNSWLETLPPVRFKVFSLQAEIASAQIKLDRRKSRLLVFKDETEESWILPISSILFIEILAVDRTFVDN